MIVAILRPNTQVLSKFQLEFKMVVKLYTIPFIVQCLCCKIH